MSKGSLEADATLVFRSTRRHIGASITTIERVSQIPVNTMALALASFMKSANATLSYSRPTSVAPVPPISSYIEETTAVNKKFKSIASSSQEKAIIASQELVAFFEDAQELCKQGHIGLAPKEALVPWAKFVTVHLHAPSKRILHT